MKSELLNQARSLYNSEFVSEEVNRANQLKWVRAITYLGDRWILAKKVGRLVKTN